MNFLPRRAVLLGFALLLPLAACDTPATRPSFPEIRFNQEPQIRLDVSRIIVQDDYHPTFREPFVEHLFPVPPARAAATWAHDRLIATGTPGHTARVRITDASVRETELPKTQGVAGAFTKDQAERYDATLAITVEILDDHGFAIRNANAQVSRTKSVVEGITPNERDQVWYDMTKEMAANLDREIEAQMRAIFGYFIQ